MGTMSSPKPIRGSDFAVEQQEFANQLGNTINPTMEQIYSILNGGVDFSNLNQELTSFTTIVDSTGSPKVKLELKTLLKTKVQGIMCIRVQGNIPSGMPLISYSYSSSSNSITISNITNLTADKEYTFTAILIG